MTMIPVGKAAKALGVSRGTLQRWDREGRLKAYRTSTGRRRYSAEQISELKGIIVSSPSAVVAYCRVSSPAQKPDLQNQRRVMEEFCTVRGLSGVEFIQEVGGGLNFKRPKFLSLMDAIGNREVKTLVVAHKDRLVRFGFEWFQHFCEVHGCELLVLNQERLSPEQEMVQDLMTIVHCFSSRLYGLRNYRKQLKEAIEADAQDS